MKKTSNKDIIYKIIDLSIEAVKICICSSNIPFVLLEDVFDNFDIPDCEKLWDYMESRKDKLTSRVFLTEASTNSKLSFLKACLGLLKRSSKSENGVFCGRVLLYLSSSLPLMEKSGLNLTKSYNLSNETTFDDEEKAQDVLSSSIVNSTPISEYINIIF